MSNIALVTIATLSLSGPSQLVKEYFLSYFMEGGLGINLTALSISFLPLLVVISQTLIP
ncbi:MAG: hypothetical protein HWD59_13960 [Coxiellaceae bacterium]|nr:MAG: hypothetical protein HWD59_13960 [Coxiellaceae bacterium]